MSQRRILLLLFLGSFFFRLGFGLLRSQIWEIDQKQTYLIGLKCYTTGTWPYFGPDVNGAENKSFHSQIPGALEGLMIGLPFYVLPIPEAPFIFLNLMSALGILLLTWYICRRIPGLSYPWLFAWITIAPWSLHEASTVINPAFTFLPSVLFFIGFMEATPLFSLGLVSLGLANALMGFSLFWIMQFHFSYVYLLAPSAYSLACQAKKGAWKGAFYFTLGALPMVALIAPTLFRYGWGQNDVASGFAVPFNWSNVGEFFTILARFLSLVCFELPRFIGIDTKSRIQFLSDHPWILAPGYLLWLAGLIQPFILLGGWFLKGDAAWTRLKYLILAILGMVEVSFWFTSKLPLSHIYFVFFPFLMAYSCHCWVRFSAKKHWRILAKVFLILGVYFQFGYAIAVAPHDSIYPGRAKITQAIREKNYHLFGERRADSLY